MSTGYFAVLRTPGVLRVFAPALLGRLSFAMSTLSLLYAVQAGTGSFAVAGAATGAFGIANVVASPHRARIVDRYGRARSLGVMSVSFGVGLVGLAALTATDRPVVWAVVGAAAATGLVAPPLGAAMRVIWGSLTPAGPIRTRAYSIDAVCEELLFTTGPLIAAAVIGIASPGAALVLTAAVAVLGTAGMVTASASRAQPSAVNARDAPDAPDAPPLRRSARRPLAQPGFIAVLAALFAVGVVLGTVEVAAPAVAERWGSVDTAGLLLAAFAGGSAAGGLLYGRRSWRASARTRLLVAAAAMVAFSFALGVAADAGAVVLGLALAGVGFFLAPSLVTGYLLADELTDESVRTEASSWINTAVNAGAAGAAVGVGSVVDAVPPQLGFVVGAATAVILLALAAAALLRRPRDVA